jgi:hypothetical protein
VRLVSKSTSKAKGETLRARIGAIAVARLATTSARERLPLRVGERERVERGERDEQRREHEDERPSASPR